MVGTSRPGRERPSLILSVLSLERRGAPFEVSLLRTGTVTDRVSPGNVYSRGTGLRLWFRVSWTAWEVERGSTSACVLL